MRTGVGRGSEGIGTGFLRLQATNMQWTITSAQKMELTTLTSGPNICFPSG
jgi:hypothetical protein